MSKKFSINSKKFSVHSENEAIYNNSLENIIRKINPGNINIDDENEQLIIVDDKTGEPFYENDFMIKTRTFMGRKYNHYIVNYSEFSKIENFVSEISDPIKGETIKLEMSFELSCIRGKGVRAIQFIKNESKSPLEILKKSITSWVRNFIEKHPSFTVDFFRLESELRSYIIDEAKRKGYRIRALSFNPLPFTNTRTAPPEHITIVHPTHCEILDDDIVVKNKIVVNLVNRRAFFWKNIDDPEKWIKQKIDAIIQNELINKSFRDIVDEFKSGYKKRISDKLENSVKEIGYSIQHIISVPSEEIADFLSGFTFNLGTQDTFETSEAEIKIRLSVTVEAKGTRLNGIDRKYIKPGESIIAKVQKQTIEVIATELRQTNPETYYSSFNDVSAGIKQKIKDRLLSVFKLDRNDLRIGISFLKTELKERFDMLFAERGKFRISSKSEDTYYEIKYGIQMVNDWHIFHKNHIKYFQKTTQEYKDISEYLKNEIEREVLRFGSAEIKSIDTQSLDAGITKLFSQAQYIITEEFGLQLKNPRLTRVSNSDLSEGNIHASAYLVKLERIKKQLKDAIIEDDDELVDELTEQLGNISAKLQNVSNSGTQLLNNGPSNMRRISNNEEE